MDRVAQLELKVRLLRSACERACAYDPEWGPERPLGFIVGVERRILHGTTPEDEIARICAESFFRSNAMFIRIAQRMRSGAPLTGGNKIIVPLTYAEVPNARSTEAEGSR